MIKAFKRTYSYTTNHEKYRIFLKKTFISCDPRYYSVVDCRDIDTVDGPMVVLKIITDAIDNPAYELIAEVWLNNEYVYLWRDQCWMIAVDHKNNAVCTPNVYQDKLPPAPHNKTLIIHQVGTLPTE